MSIAIKVSVDTDQLVMGLDRLSSSVQSSVNELLSYIGDVGVALAQGHTPRGKTGWSRASISYRIEGTSVVIYSRSWRFHFIERGTRASPGRYVPEIDARLVDPTHPSFGMHPGVPAQRPFEMARQDLESMIPSLIDQMLGSWRT